MPIEATDERNDNLPSFIEDLLSEYPTVTTIAPSISNNAMPSTLSGSIHQAPILRPNSDTESEKFDPNTDNLVPNLQDLLPMYRTATDTATATQSCSNAMFGTSSGSVHQLTRSKFDFLPCSDTESAEKSKTGALIKAPETGVQEKTITTTKMCVEWINGEQYYVCNKCNTQYVSVQKFNVHKCSDTKEVYTCDICKITFVYRRNLMTHVKEIHKTTHDAYCCTVCRKTFQAKRYLKAHMIKHNQDKPFTCTLCHKGFKYRTSLINHKKMKMGCIKTLIKTQ